MLNLLDLFARESLNWLMQSKLYSNRDIAWLHHSGILIVKGYSLCTLRLEHTVYALLGCGLVPVNFTHILKGYFTGTGAVMGVVSLTFCELSKIISWKYTMSEITFMVRISSWNMALGTLTKFQLEILIRSTISAIHKFWENMGQVTKLQLSCYQVLLSIDSNQLIAKPGNKTATVSKPDPYFVELTKR